MTLSLLLSVLLASGLLLFCGALLLHVLLLRQGRQAFILRRLSGHVPLALQANPQDAPEALRRKPQTPSWSGLMPAALTETISTLGPALRRRSLLIALAAALFLAVLLQISLALHLGIGLIASLTLILGLGLWLARLRLLRRRAAIDDALPEAMDMIVRALRVGLPIGAAIRASSRDLAGPLAEEFAETSDRISYGQDPSNALREMAERCHNQSLRFFAAAVSLQSASGGNLAEVLERLGAIARQRQQTRRKIRSITAEAKWSGRFLSAFPLLATLALLAINPGYFSEISDQPFFLPMLGLVGMLLMLNILFMRWLVKLE